MQTGKEELLTVSSTRGVVPRNTAKVTMFKAASYAGYKLCWPGDLVINSLWAWGGGLGVANHHGIISTAYSVYRARPSAQMNPKFLHELVRSSAFNWELHVRSKGIWISRLQLTDTSFLDAPIPLPPPEEQAAIVRFLDHANRKIDGFIRAKRKLIALLGEQKQAIIHRAVTRGLNPNAPQKTSSIPWLGDIPQHWEVRRAKYLFREIDERSKEGKETHLAMSQRFGLVPRRALTGNHVAAFRPQIERENYFLSPKSRKNNCCALHSIACLGLQTELKAKAALTVGYVTLPDGRCKFQTSLRQIAEMIRAVSGSGDTYRHVALHAWLTFDSGEILDLTIGPTLNAQGEAGFKEAEIIAGKLQAIAKLRYHPVAVGLGLIMKLNLLTT